MTKIWDFQVRYRNGGPRWQKATCRGDDLTPNTIHSPPSRDGCLGLKHCKKRLQTALSKQSGFPLVWPKINVHWKKGIINQSKEMILVSHLIIRVEDKEAKLLKGVCACTCVCMCMGVCTCTCVQIFAWCCKWMVNHPCYSQCGLWTSSSSITRELVRNAEYWVLPNTY